MTAADTCRNLLTSPGLCDVYACRAVCVCVCVCTCLYCLSGSAVLLLLFQAKPAGGLQLIISLSLYRKAPSRLMVTCLCLTA